MRPIVGAVVLLCASSALADDVVLRNGRTFSGRIVEESDAKVVLETSVSKMSFDRGQIQEIRRGPPPKETPPAPPPPPPAAKKPEGRKDAPPAAKKPNEPKKAPETQRRRAEKRLEELEAIRLAPWQEGGSTRATEWPRKNYKVIGMDGRATMRDERPAAPDGVSELYVLTDAEDGQAIVWLNGERLMYWRRLFWHDDDKKWYVNAPELDAYFKDRAWADAIADLSCKDTNGLVGVAMAQDHLKAAWFKDPASCGKELAEVRKECAEATVSEEAAELLAQVIQMNVEAEAAKRATDKIAVAMKRRDVLRRLVETMRN